jgi:NitT/TauT family transport system permease protein
LDVGGEFARSWDLIISNTLTTAIEATFGVMLGCLIGVLVGTLMAASRPLENVLMPLVVSSNVIPVVAIAPLVILWFGFGLMSKVIVAAFLSFFPIALNAYDGLRDRGGNERDLFVILGASKQQYFRLFRLPSAIPSFFTGLKISGVLAVIGAVVSEFIGSDSGLGFGMLQARYNLNTTRLFCYTIVSCILGLLVYWVVVLLERTVANKKRWSWIKGRE